MANTGLTKALPRLVDIAVNLTDPVFHGVDHKGKQLHDDDFDLMMERAERVGVNKMIVTGTSYRQSIEAIQLCRQFPDRLRCTVGVHPAHCTEFEREGSASQVHRGALPASPARLAEEHLHNLVQLVKDNKDVVVGVGEIGMDYAELSECPRETQRTYFQKQLEAFRELDLPFFFHSRDCGMEFVKILSNFLQTCPSNPPLRGVVHSFNGSPEEQDKLLDMGLYLSLNGSAFRTKDLALQVSRIPLNRLLVETDAPWCDIRKKDYGYQFVSTFLEFNRKGKPFVMGKCLERRNEPCHLLQVLEAFLGCRKEAVVGEDLSLDTLAETLRCNCCNLCAWKI